MSGDVPRRSRRSADAPAPGGKWPAAKRTEALALFGISGNAREVARELRIPHRTVTRWIAEAKPEEVERYRREASDAIGELALATSRKALEIAGRALERDGGELDAVSAARACRDLTASFGRLADARQVRERVAAEVDRELDDVLGALQEGLGEDAFRRAADIIAGHRSRSDVDENAPDDSPLPPPELDFAPMSPGQRASMAAMGPPPGGWFVVGQYAPHGWEQHGCGRYVPAEWWIAEVRQGTRIVPSTDEKHAFAQALRAGARRWGPPVVPLPPGMTVARVEGADEDPASELH